MERVSDTLGQPIVPIPMIMPSGGPSGLLIRTTARDYIFFSRITSRVHQENIILHEVVHRLRDHKGLHDLDGDRSRALFPDLDPDLVISMLARAAYSDEQEREAEFLASLLRTRMASWSQSPEWVIPADIAEVIDRIERVLGS
ncbi:hypothetical protein IU500_08750 [Nocardia terpenica]|uniref:hypothetical protein n=1 Tax=Nocardia terpenica TaxID=455432 RepID=UPI0018934E2E|nr:hypothetical protein [Nocardia terpenica]MBF6060866.1 hypothetical protein [Nocardia terpenica]MBF6104126.1 hypothetical protein [Nocardia terpenica]MBF6111500.1 hypothetical protein [Nocardia terpenica]MBF6118347.1 hypothetical protein [Nocardia terpenica]MBF6155669.1 hypothetical protein [Nocardia terpenica]